MHEKEKWIRQKIKNRWLLGKTPDGGFIGVYRSQGYAELKARINNQAGLGNVDLTLTGALGDKIAISGFDDEYEIFSEDTKYESIVEKYGYHNFNISDDEERQLFDEIASVVLTDIMNKSYALL